MEEYKLSIANIIFDSVRNDLNNQLGVTREMILGEINRILNDLNLDVDDWFKYIYESIRAIDLKCLFILLYLNMVMIKH